MKMQELLRKIMLQMHIETACRAASVSAGVTAVICCLAEVPMHLFLSDSTHLSPFFIIGCFLMIMVLVWFLQRPTKLAAARRGDRELEFEARLETAVAFADDRSLFAEMQRREAEEAVLARSDLRIPIQLPRKTPAAAVATICLAAGLTLLPYGILLPKEKNAGSGVDAEVLAFQTSIRELSQMQAEAAELAKDGAAGELDAYLTALSELMETYGLTAAEAEAQIKKNIEDMGIDLSEAMGAYTTLISSLLQQSYWRETALALLASDTEALQAAIESLEEELTSYPVDKECREIYECSYQLMAVVQSQSEDDAYLDMAGLFQDTYLELQGIAENPNPVKVNVDQSLIELLEGVKIQLFKMIQGGDGKSGDPDSKNPMKADVTGMLSTGENKEVARDLDPERDGTGGKSRDDAYISGGDGIRKEKTMGNPEYADHIQIFDPLTSAPDTGEYVPYGNVYGRYYQRMTEEVSGGTIPDDVLDSINEYFGGL